MFNLNDKKAVITGAGSGIGRAIAKTFAARGAAVHVLDIGEDAAREVAQEIRRDGGTATVHACNVTSQADVLATFAAIGPLDILVNNAGIAHVGKADTTAEADFDRVMAVNVKGVYNCLHAAIPQLRANGGGVILNMASVAARVAVADRFAYSTGKGAVMAMTLSVAKDYIHDGIRCNSISPGRVHTPFVDGFLAKNYPGREAEMFDKLSKTQPIGRMAQPDEVAALALYLCSDEASFITGTDYPIDGGFITLNS
ncbi:SDR family NAD(P)-dependent oxidoreductase [Pseudoduganella lutea]|uniref:SDR family oxidoreductase n=1 Tax=Pseudoduganella lutea TaxID=321985 RepID=A0A4P6KSP4_9BURK|nr:SDR family oxidoreductase [Pseudoduganella lutea]QBE61706.1 SDR family oxidoreductase [Pseudoduganella lutea]